LIYRIVRSPERRVFYVDPGNLPFNKAEEYLQKIINTYKSKKTYDESSGTLSSKVKHPSMLEDFFLLKRQDQGTKIETLPSVGGLGEIDDLLYFQRKAAKSLRVPINRLIKDGQSEQSPYSQTATEINNEEYRFNRFINVLRRKFNGLFYELLKRQLVYKNIIKIEDWHNIKNKINFIWQDDTTAIMEKKLGTLEKRLNILRDAKEYVGEYLLKEQVYKDVMGMTEQEIEEFERKQLEEKGKYGDEAEKPAGQVF
jgi:hypothetical protein